MKRKWLNEILNPKNRFCSIFSDSNHTSLNFYRGGCENLIPFVPTVHSVPYSPVLETKHFLSFTLPFVSCHHFFIMHLHVYQSNRLKVRLQIPVIRIHSGLWYLRYISMKFDEWKRCNHGAKHVTALLIITWYMGSEVYSHSSKMELNSNPVILSFWLQGNTYWSARVSKDWQC